MTQFNANDAKESMTLAPNSTQDQMPKEVSQVIDASNNAFIPVQLSTEQTTPVQTAVGLSDAAGALAPETIAPIAPIAPIAHQPVATVENKTPTVVSEPQKDLEAASPTKAQPVRKISRFLVSPAILTVANEKSICIEEPIKSPPPTITQAPNVLSSDIHQIPSQNQVQQLIPNDDQLRAQQQQQQQQQEVRLLRLFPLKLNFS